MGWLFGSKKKSFNLPVSTATQVVNIITEADKHAYSLSKEEAKLERTDLTLFDYIKKNVLNGIIYSENQFKHGSLSEGREDVIYKLFIEGSEDIEKLKHHTLKFKRVGEEIIDFVSKSEHAINKYIRDKGHDEAVELKLILEHEKRVVHDAVNLTKDLEDLKEEIRALVNLFDIIKKSDGNSFKSSFSRFKALGNTVRTRVNKIENVIKHMRRLNHKIRVKLERVSRLDERLNNDLRQFVAEAESKHLEYKGGHV